MRTSRATYVRYLGPMLCLSLLAGCGHPEADAVAPADVRVVPQARCFVWNSQPEDWWPAFIAAAARAAASQRITLEDVSSLSAGEGGGALLDAVSAESIGWIVFEPDERLDIALDYAARRRIPVVCCRLSPPRTGLGTPIHRAIQVVARPRFETIASDLAEHLRTKLDVGNKGGLLVVADPESPSGWSDRLVQELVSVGHSVSLRQYTPGHTGRAQLVRFLDSVHLRCVVAETPRLVDELRFLRERRRATWSLIGLDWRESTLVRVREGEIAAVVRPRFDRLAEQLIRALGAVRAQRGVNREIEFDCEFVEGDRSER